MGGRVSPDLSPEFSEIEFRASLVRAVPVPYLSLRSCCSSSQQTPGRCYQGGGRAEPSSFPAACSGTGLDVQFYLFGVTQLILTPGRALALSHRGRGDVVTTQISL